METTGKTQLIISGLSHCDNLEDFRKDIFSKVEGQKEKWTQKFASILAETGISQTEMARRCGVSKTTVTKWCRGSLPQNRETFIKIGFAAGYDLKEMNRFLQRYGRYPELYPKTPEDSVYIFVLNSETIEHTYESCRSIMDQIQKVFAPASEEVITTVETERVMEQVLNMKQIEELRQFLQTHSSLITTSFGKFYDYVKDFVRRNNESYIDQDNPDNINSLADTLGWSSSLRKCVYSIFKHEWFPLRNKVISLGVHLNMTLDEINEMLHLAKMEPLYVVNPTECILSYAILEAELEEEICEGTDDLYNHVVEVMQEMGVSDEEYELCDY